MSMAQRSSSASALRRTLSELDGGKRPRSCSGGGALQQCAFSMLHAERESSSRLSMQGASSAEAAPSQAPRASQRQVPGTPLAAQRAAQRRVANRKSTMRGGAAPKAEAVVSLEPPSRLGTDAVYQRLEDTLLTGRNQSFERYAEMHNVISGQKFECMDSASLDHAEQQRFLEELADLVRLKPKMLSPLHEHGGFAGLPQACAPNLGRPRSTTESSLMTRCSGSKFRPSKPLRLRDSRALSMAL